MLIAIWVCTFSFEGNSRLSVLLWEYHGVARAVRKHQKKTQGTLLDAQLDRTQRIQGYWRRHVRNVRNFQQFGFDEAASQFEQVTRDDTEIAVAQATVTSFASQIIKKEQNDTFEGRTAE